MADSSFFTDGGSGSGTFQTIETKIAEAEAAKVAAEAAQAAAEQAETDAQTAEAGSVAAKNTAVASSSNAAISESNAASSSTNASNKASDAQKLAINAEDSLYTLSDGSTTGYSALHYNAKAADSLVSATTQASNAAASAVTAEQHKDDAESAKTSAESARDSALASFDSFDDRYLGAKTSDPSVDNDGNSLVAGALYFNEQSGDMKVFNGTSWVDAYADGATLVAKAGDTMTGNLSFGDNNKAIFGAGSDLQIYHDGSNSIVKDNGTGNLELQGSSWTILKGATSGTWGIAHLDGAQTNLYHNGNLKLATTSTGVDVTGNVTVSGTVDGRDVAADGTKLDGIEASATADQTAAEIRTLVESATDSNVFTDADHTKLNGIETGATADQTAAQILTAIKTVDGSGSGLDADTVDGLQASSFLRSDADDSVSSYTNQITFPSNSAIATASGNQASLQVYQGTANADAFMQFHIAGDYALYFGLDGTTNDLAVGGWSKGANKYKVWHAANDGSGSGLDADTVDGIQASSFLRSDQSDTMTGTLSIAQFSSSSKFSFLNGSSAQGIRTNSVYAGVSYAADGSGSGEVDALNGYRVAGTQVIDSSRIAYFTNGVFDNGASTTLSVRGSGTGTAKIWARGSNQATAMVMVSQDDSHGGGIEYNGDNNPVSTGAGADYIALFRVSSGTYAWTARNAYSNNDWQFRGNVTAYASDERLKENIETIPNALDKVCKLRGVTFDWKDDCEDKGFMPTMQHETGVIAQEVQAVIPDAAVPAPFDEEYLTVKHEKIIPVLIEAIKELKQEIEELKKG